MPTHKTDHLLELVKSLSKNEKRNFKLFAQKSGNSDKLYVTLFDLLSKTGEYDEIYILKKIPELKKSQLSNLKANLYKQLLRSLRDFNKDEYEEIKAREHFDFAKILYAKRQYVASLEMLGKVKKIANKIQNKPLEYLALNFEKLIESQHVTGSMYPKAKTLSDESDEVIRQLVLTNKLTNLALMLYGLYLQRGFVKNKEDETYLNDYFFKEIPELDIQVFDFYQKLFYYQCYSWYYYIKQDFLMYYRYSQKWVDVFNEFPGMKIPATTFYLKGLHNVLDALFYCNDLKRFNHNFEILNNVGNDKKLKLSRNENSQLFLFKYTHWLDGTLLTGEFYSDDLSIQQLNIILENNEYNWDDYRMMLFNYKIAGIYFINGDLNNTIEHLNKIINQYYPDLKEDVQCYARILNLIAHFELGNEELVVYEVKSVYRFLLKMSELQGVQKEILKFIRKTPRIFPRDIKNEFILLKERLEVLFKNPYERRFFLYLDILSWLDTKIEGITMKEAFVRRKMS